MMLTGWPPATGSAAIRTASKVEDEVGEAEKRRGHGVGMEMGGLHAPDSSQRSQLQPSPMSCYTMAPRASLDMALSLAGNGVRCVP
jgi:hypothetical protein